MKLRLAGFVLAIGTLASLIVWAALTSSRRVEESREQLMLAESESFRIAGHFQEGLRGLDHALLMFALHGDTNDWAKSEDGWEVLNDWLDRQHLSSPSEKDFLGQINAAYDDYHDAARKLKEQVRAGSGTALPIHEFVRLQRESGRLMNLSFKLADAHRRTLVASLADTQESVAQLRAVLLAALFVLLALGVWLSVVVYRQLIAPLRVKLVESQALLERQEKLASLGVLAAGVAHEIRNPLTAIKAWLFMHHRKLRPATQEFADAELMARELGRLERIVGDFLLFARPSEPQFQVIPADEPLREVRDLLAPGLGKSDIHVVVENPCSLAIRVDPQQIKQVLINLIQNAADAIGRDGTVTLRARMDRKRLADEETDVVIVEVSDTGKGIPPEIEKRLFDPFFTTKDSGTGLGLSIAARIVEKHGGVLQYQPRAHHGTTFGIVLRRAADHEKQNPPDRR